MSDPGKSPLGVDNESLQAWSDRCKVYASENVTLHIDPLTVCKLVDEIVELRFQRDLSKKMEKHLVYQGYAQAVDDFAIWRNGEQLVGALERPKKEVLERKAQEMRL